MSKTETTVDSLEGLRGRLRLIAAARNWGAFHTPKNLAAAVAVEAGDLLREFRWLSAEESLAPGPETRAAATEEMMDVLFYLIRLADRLEVDLPTAIDSRLAVLAARLPVTTDVA